MEEYVLAELRYLIGFDEGDGIFCPGGSIANGYAINCARYKMFPQIKVQINHRHTVRTTLIIYYHACNGQFLYEHQEKGLHALPRLVLFTSNDAHYSIKKLAAFEGLGSDNVYLVKTDERGKMDVGDLENQVQKSLSENAVPFMVSATAGELKENYSFVWK